MNNNVKYKSQLLGAPIKTICFTGSRPNNLYGYDMNRQEYKELIKKLKDVLLNEVEITNGRVQCISGGALGIDTIAFRVVKEIGIRYNTVNTIAVPFKFQYVKWPKESQANYFEMLSDADDVFYVDELNKDKNPGEYANYKLLERNKWMVDHSDIVIAVYRKDKFEDSKGTKHCVNYALNQGKKVIRVEL